MPVIADDTETGGTTYGRRDSSTLSDSQQHKIHTGLGKILKIELAQALVSQSLYKDNATTTLSSTPMIDFLALTEFKNIVLRPALATVQGILNRKRWICDHVVPYVSQYVLHLSQINESLSKKNIHKEVFFIIDGGRYPL